MPSLLGLNALGISSNGSIGVCLHSQVRGLYSSMVKSLLSLQLGSIVVFTQRQVIGSKLSAVLQSLSSQLGGGMGMYSQVQLVSL